MSILTEIADLNPTRATVVGLIVAAILPPGFLTIFVFGRELFMAMDVFKLTLLAVSISISYLFAFISAVLLPEVFFGKHENADLLAAVIMGILLANLSSYFLLLNGWLGGEPCTKFFSKMMAMAFVGFIAFLIPAVIRKVSSSFAKRRNLQKEPDSDNINPKSEQAPTQPI